MSIRIARLALILLAVMVMGVYIPKAQKMLCDENMGKTQLFYSPVIKKFIYREKVGEGHNYVTRDEDGKAYDRATFETMIPFIYYKNMELWGKLPLVIDGQTFTKEHIRASRQVFELKSRSIADRSPRIQVFPLLESVPGRSRLRFPEDVFRMTDTMEFINVDTNTVDPALTQTYTSALTEKGFTFPAKLVGGKVSILKPFDEGFFIVDAKGAVFHVKRINGEPYVVKTPIPADLDIRHIKVSENRKKDIYGLVLTENRDMYLLTYDNYSRIKLPLKNYDPDTMDFKLLINPVVRTAVYSDHKTIHAVAMNKDWRPLAMYDREMVFGKITPCDRVFEAFFPFVVQTTDTTSGYLPFRIVWNGLLAGIGMAVSLLIGAVFIWRRDRNLKRHWPDLLLIACTGLYGLIAMMLIGSETS